MWVICRYVCEKMGGAVSREKASCLGYELPLMQLKQKLNSNLVPIGLITTGAFQHRALLFKVCCKISENVHASVIITGATAR